MCSVHCMPALRLHDVHRSPRANVSFSAQGVSLSLSPSLYSRAVTIIPPPLNCAAFSSEQQMRVSVTDILMAPLVNAFSPFLYFFSPYGQVWDGWIDGWGCTGSVSWRAYMSGPHLFTRSRGFFHQQRSARRPALPRAFLTGVVEGGAMRRTAPRPAAAADLAERQLARPLV